MEKDETKQKRILPEKHSGLVWSLSFSPDGRFLASEKSEISIWSTEVRNRVKDACTGSVNWTCAVCCCRFTSSNESTNRRAPVSSFISFFFRFPPFPFILDLGAPNYLFRRCFYPLFSRSLVDATRLVE